MPSAVRSGLGCAQGLPISPFDIGGHDVALPGLEPKVVALLGVGKYTAALAPLHLEFLRWHSLACRGCSSKGMACMLSQHLVDHPQVVVAPCPAPMLFSNARCLWLDLRLEAQRQMTLERRFAHPLGLSLPHGIVTMGPWQAHAVEPGSFTRFRHTCVNNAFCCCCANLDLPTGAPSHWPTLTGLDLDEHTRQAIPFTPGLSASVCCLSRCLPYATLMA